MRRTMRANHSSVNGGTIGCSSLSAAAAASGSGDRSRWSRPRAAERASGRRGVVNGERQLRARQSRQSHRQQGVQPTTAVDAQTTHRAPDVINLMGTYGVTSAQRPSQHLACRS